MLPSLNLSESRATRRTILFLGLVALGALALPTLNWTTQVQSGGLASALAQEKGDPFKGAGGSDRRDKPVTGLKGRDGGVELEYLPRPTKSEEMILAALEKPVKVEFLDLALEDCIHFLQNSAQLNIWMDKQTLTDEGVALDQPVTLKLEGARLESVLNLLLKPVQLTYYPEDDVLVITTSAKAGETLITRTYPVRDLYQGRIEANVDERPVQTEKAAAAGARGSGGGFFGIESLPARRRPLDSDAIRLVGAANVDDREQGTELTQGFGGGKAGGAPAAAANEGAPAAAKQQPAPRRYTDLIDAITNTIEPDSWEDLSGPGTYTYVKETGCLVIRQTWAIHRKILQLLRDLREAKHLAPGGEAKK